MRIAPSVTARAAADDADAQLAEVLGERHDVVGRLHRRPLAGGAGTPGSCRRVLVGAPARLRPPLERPVDQLLVGDAAASTSPVASADGVAVAGRRRSARRAALRAAPPAWPSLRR